MRWEPGLAREALACVDALHRLARHLTGSDADAEDLVQDAYARAFGARAQFTAGTNLRAWLFRILRNAYIDASRRTQNSPVRGEPSGADVFEGAEPKFEPLRGDRELDRLRSVVARDIEVALASLPVDAKMIVLLDLEGLTEAELAEVFGCAEGTIKSRLHRARTFLRERLSDYSG
jgi:RNA polymerase sigma-70 factor (ECF subfamily)